MKKLLLGLGSVVAVVAPIATVVACNGDDKEGIRTGLVRVSGADAEIMMLVNANVKLTEEQAAAAYDVFVKEQGFASVTNIMISTGTLESNTKTFSFSITAGATRKDFIAKAITVNTVVSPETGGINHGNVNPLFSSLTTSTVIEDLDSNGLGTKGTGTKGAAQLSVSHELVEALKGLTTIGTVAAGIAGESEGRVYFGESAEMLIQIGSLQSGANNLKFVTEVSSSIGESAVHTACGGRVKYFLDKTGANGKRAFSKVISSTSVEYIFSITMD